MSIIRILRIYHNFKNHASCYRTTYKTLKPSFKSLGPLPLAEFPTHKQRGKHEVSRARSMLSMHPLTVGASGA
jgi:hypothetical protein